MDWTSPSKILGSRFASARRPELARVGRPGNALSFEPERVIYDSEEELLRIFASDGARVIPCAVSKAALAALEDATLRGPDAEATAYRQNKELIQAIAQRKYRDHRFETGGIVVVRLQDLPT